MIKIICLITNSGLPFLFSTNQYAFKFILNKGEYIRTRIKKSISKKHRKKSVYYLYINAESQEFLLEGSFQTLYGDWGIFKGGKLSELSLFDFTSKYDIKLSNKEIGIMFIKNQ